MKDIQINNDETTPPIANHRILKDLIVSRGCLFISWPSDPNNNTEMILITILLSQ